MGVDPIVARELALALLPHPADLWGDGWVQHLGVGDASGSEPLADTCLPSTFPEEAVSGAMDATFVHETDGIVLALVTVFDAEPAAVRGWEAVRTDEFAACLTRSVLRDVDAPERTELLGPVFGDGPRGPRLRSAGRTRCRHAVLAAASGGGLSSLELDLAAVQTGPALVLLWSAHPGSHTASAGWARLIERVELRSEEAVRQLAC